MAAFFTFINFAIHVCSDSRSLNSEIQYFKVIMIDRGYNSSVIDPTLNYSILVSLTQINPLLFLVLALCYLFFPKSSFLL